MINFKENDKYNSRSNKKIFFRGPKGNFKNEKSNWQKDESKRLAWELYADGYSQREIAKDAS